MSILDTLNDRLNYREKMKNFKRRFDFIHMDVNGKGGAEVEARIGSLVRNAFLLSFDTVMYTGMAACEAVALVVRAGTRKEDNYIPLSFTEQIKEVAGMEPVMLTHDARQVIEDALMRGGAVAYDASVKFVSEMHTPGKGHDKYIRRFSRELENIGYDVKKLVGITINSEVVRNAGSAVCGIAMSIREEGISFFNKLKKGIKDELVDAKRKIDGMDIKVNIQKTASRSLEKVKAIDFAVVGSAVRGKMKNPLSAVLIAGSLLSMAASGAESVPLNGVFSVESSPVFVREMKGPELASMVREKLPKDKIQTLETGLPVRMDAVEHRDGAGTPYYTFEPSIDPDQISNFSGIPAPKVPKWLSRFFLAGIPFVVSEREDRLVVDYTKIQPLDVQRIGLPREVCDRLLEGGLFELRTVPVFDRKTRVKRLEYTMCDQNEPDLYLSKMEEKALKTYCEQTEFKGVQTVEISLKKLVGKIQERDETAFNEFTMRVLAEIENARDGHGEFFDGAVAGAARNACYSIAIDLAKIAEQGPLEKTDKEMEEIFTRSARLLSLEGNKDALAGLALLSASRCDGEEGMDMAECRLSSLGISPDAALEALGKVDVVAEALAAAGITAVRDYSREAALEGPVV